MNFWQGLLAVVLMFTCLLLMLVILLQRGRGGGLVGAFGGAGGTSAFGAKTGDVFTWITVIVAGIFVLLSIAANFVFDQSPRPKQTPSITDVTPALPATGTTPGPIEPTSQLPIKIERLDTPPIDPATGQPIGVPKSDVPNSGATGAETKTAEPPKPADSETVTPPTPPEKSEEPKKDDSGNPAP